MIRYKKYKTDNLKNTNSEYFIRPILWAPTTTDEIALKVSEMCSFTPGDVHGVLIALRDVLTLEFMYSKSVHLRGLGHFRVVLGSEAEIQPDKTRNNKIYIKGIRFKPDNELMKEIKFSASYKFLGTDSDPKPQRERFENIIECIKNNGRINVYEAGKINSCSYATTKRDINKLKISNLLKMDYRSIYIATDKLIESNYEVDYQNLLAVRISR